MDMQVEDKVLNFELIPEGLIIWIMVSELLI